MLRKNLLAFKLAWSGNQELDPLLRREMRERWRRPLTYLLLAVYSAILAFLAYTFYTVLVPQGDLVYGANTVGLGRPYFLRLAGCQIILSHPVGIMLASPTLAVERERKSLIEYLLAGLTPQQIVLAKFWSVGSFALMLAVLPFPVIALCFPLGGVSLADFGAAFFLALGTAVSGAAYGIVVSAAQTRVTSAMLSGLLASAILTGTGGVAGYGLLYFPPFLAMALAVLCTSIVSALSLEWAIAEVDCISRHLEAEESYDLPPIIIQAPRPTTHTTPLPGALTTTLRTTRSKNFTPTPVHPPITRKTAPHVLQNIRPFPLPWIDVELERLASYNPISRREVAAQLNLWRVLAALGDLPSSPYHGRGTFRSQFWPWSGTGVMFGILCWWYQTEWIWHVAWEGMMLLALGLAAVLGSSAFTREREQKMLSMLQLTALSPLEIVVGKIWSTLLLATRPFLWPLWAIWLASWVEGPFMSMGVALLTLTSITLAACLSVTTSLLCRHTTIAAGSALCALAGFFVVLPTLVYEQQMWLDVPGVWAPLQRAWVDPLEAFFGMKAPDLPVSLGLQLLAGECGLIALLLVGFCTWQLSRTRVEEEHHSVWQRNLSRSWK